MPRLSTSDRVRARVRNLLGKLLAYANHEFAYDGSFENKLKVRWVDENTRSPRLVVQTKLKFLVELIFSVQNHREAKEHLRHDLRVLEEFLGILEDNRVKAQGADDWHFTLKLWDKSTQRNLSAFDQEWRSRKSQKTSNQRPELSPQSSDAIPAAYQDSAIAPSEANEANATSELWATTFNRATRPAHNLPARQHSAFIGLRSQMTRLLKLLSIDHPANLISIRGVGGIGKTTLALEAAHRCLLATQHPQAYPGVPDFDAIIFTSAQSHHFLGPQLSTRIRPERNLQDVIRAIAAILNLLDSLPSELDAQLATIRERLARQRTLLLVDNLETLDDQAYILSFLRELPSTVKTILTSRVRGGWGPSITLNYLNEAEGLELIHHYAQEKELQLSPVDAEVIYQRTGGLPLAIAYAIGQIDVFGLAPESVPQLATHDDLIRYCFETSVQQIRGQSAHALLMALALFPRSASGEALVYVAFPVPEPMIIQQGFGKLYQLSLVIVQERRYILHSLTREYVNAEVRKNPDFEQAARDRWVTWYLQFLQPYGEKNWRDWQDYSTLDVEWENLRVVMDWCRVQSRYEDFKQLWQNLKGYTQLRGHWNDRLSWMSWLQAEAEQREDAATVVNVLYNTSLTLFFFNQREQTERAIALSQQAWELASAQPELRVDIATHLAGLHSRLRQFEQATQWMEQIETLLKSGSIEEPTRSRQWVELLYYKAEVLLKHQDYAQAKQLYSEALGTAETIGWQRLTAYIKGWLAVVAIAQGKLDEAEQLLTAVFSAAQSHNDRRCLVTCQSHFARIERSRGDVSKLRKWAQVAREGFEQLNMKEQAAEMNALLQ